MRTVPVSSVIPALRLSGGVTGAETAESEGTDPRALSGMAAGAVVVSCLVVAALLSLLSTTSQAKSDASTSVITAVPEDRQTSARYGASATDRRKSELRVLRCSGFMGSPSLGVPGSRSDLVRAAERARTRPDVYRGAGRGRLTAMHGRRLPT